MRLKGKIAIVTGGTTGIGRASAVLFAREGAQVVISDWRTDRSEPVIQEVAALGGKALIVQADVSSRSDNERLVETCVERFGRVDILFCNAGRFLPRVITETSDEDI